MQEIEMDIQEEITAQIAVTGKVLRPLWSKDFLTACYTTFISNRQIQSNLRLTPESGGHADLPQAEIGNPA